MQPEHQHQYEGNKKECSKLQEKCPCIFYPVATKDGMKSVGSPLPCRRISGSGPVRSITVEPSATCTCSSAVGVQISWQAQGQAEPLCPIMPEQLL